MADRTHFGCRDVVESPATCPTRAKDFMSGAERTPHTPEALASLIDTLTDQLEARDAAPERSIRALRTSLAAAQQQRAAA